MRASVLIVTYRNPDLTRACLRSVFEQTGGDFEVVVVDNSSGDGTPEMIAAEFPQVRLIEAGANLGFAAGNNRAAAAATGDTLVLLNPDTVVHDRALEQLVAFLDARPDLGLAGGRTLSPGGAVDRSSCWGPMTLWSLACFATLASTAFPRSRWLNPESLGAWQRDSVRDVGIVSGCLCAVRRGVWDRLGGFDERFFMYGEDMDLSLRVAAAGLRLAITPTATITHVVGASSNPGAKAVTVLAAKVEVLRKHWRPGRARLGVALLTVGVAARALADGVAGRLGRPAAGAWGHAWRQRAVWQAGALPAPAG